MAPLDPPSAGTGNLLLANPPFIFDSMDTNQPAPTDGLPELTEAEFLRLSAAAGGSGHPFEACNYGHALRIARAAYRMGADVELAACCDWLAIGGPRGSTCHHSDLQNAQDLRTARRPKPLSLKQQALIILDDCSARLDAAHENTLRRALEALPE